MTGSILCRLPTDTIVVREVGLLLETKRFTGAFFVAQAKDMDAQKFEMPPSTIEGLIKIRQFQMPILQIHTKHQSQPVDIMLQLPDGETYSISGFPRVLYSRLHSEFLLHRNRFPDSLPLLMAGEMNPFFLQHSFNARSILEQFWQV